MNPNTKKIEIKLLKKQIPYWLALLIGTFATCLTMNVLTPLYLNYEFNSWWRLLASPPAGAAKIINAVDYEVWVESHNGKIFTTSILCYSTDESCFQWVEVKYASEIPKSRFPLVKLTSCKDLRDGIFPLDPSGEIVECVFSDSDHLITRDENYFALMTDGSLKYWQDYGMWQFESFYFTLSTYVLPFLLAILISIFYLINYVIKRVQQNREK